MIYVNDMHTIPNSGADNCKNTWLSDASMKFGTDTFEVHFLKKSLATQNSNIATIFQDGRHLHKVVKMQQ